MQSLKSYLDAKKDRKQKEMHQDQKYIVALQNNDVGLIDEIYKNYSNMIIDLIKKNNGSVDDAKDIFQEVLIILHKYSHNGFELTCSLKSFLYTLCKRRWINELKKKGRSHTIQVADIQDLNFANESQSDVFEIEEQENKLSFCKSIFQLMSPACKELLRTAWKQDENGKYKSWKLIAVDLGLSYGYVRKKATECKKRLVELSRKNPGFKRNL